MDPITQDDLTELIEKQEGPCVSLYLCTIRAGEETQQNPIRFKNLLRLAEQRLVEAGLRAPEARKLVGPAVERLNDETYWREQSDGLALFLAPDLFKIYRLPLDFEERVIVANRFYTKPLLPLFANDGRFYILALSQNRVRLLEGSRYEVQELELKDVPLSLAEAQRWDVGEEHIQFHSASGPTTGGTRRQVIYHVQGGASDEANQKADILRFFQEVDRGLRNYLDGQNIPLVLAGVEYLISIYREASAYPHLVAPSITGNPENMKAEELHQRAWEILEPFFKQDQEQAAELYLQQAGMQAGTASDDVATIASAAYYGRVGQLFVQEGVETWGFFDPQTGRVSIHAEDRPTPEDMDLLDLAAAYTLLNRGSVYVVPAEEMPVEAPAAAVLRY